MAHVSRVEFDSEFGDGGELEITLARGLPRSYPTSPQLADVPPDFIAALIEWLRPALDKQ